MAENKKTMAVVWNDLSSEEKDFIVHLVKKEIPEFSLPEMALTELDKVIKHTKEVCLCRSCYIRQPQVKHAVMDAIKKVRLAAGLKGEDLKGGPSNAFVNT